MGMAASQARLLSLTSRLHDVELKAQSIESQKIALATQKDELYQNYCDALDATKIQVAFRNDDATVKYVDANFSTLCTYSDNRVKQYALRDTKTGNLIVSQEVYDNYYIYGDKYSFAYAMVGFEGAYGFIKTDDDGELIDDNRNQGIEVGIGNAQRDYGYTSNSGTGYSLYMTECEQNVYDAHTDDSELVDAFDAIEECASDGEKKTALKAFRELLYDKYSSEIYDQMDRAKEKSDNADGISSSSTDKTWDEYKAEFNYYVNLYEGIEQAGGCIPIDKQFQSGENGNTWLNNMVESGLVTIQVYESDSSEPGWTDTNVATSTNENYLQETQDEKDLKKAEAEYEYELDKINQKDTKFDTELSKLETERTSITTEIESVQKVRDDNIERTFGIFS